MSKGRERLRLTLKSLLLATAFIGAGAGVLVPLMRAGFIPFREAKLVLAFALIGAGVLLPFHRARLGAYIGFFGILIYALAFEVYRWGWAYIWEPSGLMVISACTSLALALGAFSIARILWRRLSGFPEISD